MLSDPIMLRLRQEYHEKLCRYVLGRRRNGAPVVNIADKHSELSRSLAEKLVKKIGWPICERPPSEQTVGKLFAQYTRDFLEQAFARLSHIRPGQWRFTTQVGTLGITAFAQYEHLAEVERMVREVPRFQALLGNVRDYLVTPDIVVSRLPLSDVEINERENLVDGSVVSSLTPLRELNSTLELLHASVSCKWTIRSDRAQNVRTEALNLIRNRRGNLPSIVVVTMEPMPSRIASVAIGTGDIDCTYHGALYELQSAVEESSYQDAKEMLRILVEGKRLRDISDLPFDLAC